MIIDEPKLNVKRKIGRTLKTFLDYFLDLTLFEITC